MLVHINLAVVAVYNLELHHRAVGDVGRELCNQRLCHLLDVGIADVLKVGQTLALKECRRTDKHLRGQAKHTLLLRLLLCHAPRGSITEEDEINYLLVQLPCRREVGAHISTGDCVAVRVVHRKANLRESGPAVVLCRCRPCVPERIDTVAFLRVGHAHVLTDFLDTCIDVGAETVRGREAVAETEQAVGMVTGPVLVEQWLYHLRHPHLDVSVIAAALGGLGSLVVDDASVVVLLALGVNIDSGHAGPRRMPGKPRR